MKTCVGMEAYIQIFLFSVLEVSGSAELPRDSLNAGEKREKVSYLYCKCKFESTVAQPEAYSLYRPQTIPTQLSLFHSRRSRCKQTCSIYKKIFVVLIFRSSSNTFIPSGRQVFAQLLHPKGKRVQISNLVRMLPASAFLPLHFSPVRLYFLSIFPSVRIVYLDGKLYKIYPSSLKLFTARQTLRYGNNAGCLLYRTNTCFSASCLSTWKLSFVRRTTFVGMVL